MSTWAKFRALPRSEKWLLIRAGVEVLRARIGLSCLPFSWHAARIICTQPNAISNALTHKAERIVWAVSVASRFVPRASCLTQALAAKRLLNAAGISSQVHLACGVDKDGVSGAHAWLECEGNVVLGGTAPVGFVALPALKS